jgi:sialidase-1
MKPFSHLVSVCSVLLLWACVPVRLAAGDAATIISNDTICQEAGRYIGWPTITQTRDGELLVVFSGDRDAHICPWGITQMVRSHDRGRTWSLPETINNSPLDDRDAGIIQTKSGALVVSWFTSIVFANPAKVKWQNLEPELLESWQRHIAKVGPETRDAYLGNWTRRSPDGGRTWEKPVKQIVSAPHGPIQLRDGRLLYVGLGTFERTPKLGVEESRDDGRSWQYLADIPVAEEDQRETDWRIRMEDEPHVVELKDGKLVALIRAEPKDHAQCFLRQSESADGGKSWSVTHKTPIYGYPPHLVRLQNDWLLVVYGVRREPYGERACLSKDGGKTWDIQHEITLRPAFSGDLGYPSSVQLDDRSILTVYYQSAQPGKKTSLLSTHWKLNE